MSKLRESLNRIISNHNRLKKSFSSLGNVELKEYRKILEDRFTRSQWASQYENRWIYNPGPTVFTAPNSTPPINIRDLIKTREYFSQKFKYQKFPGILIK